MIHSFTAQKDASVYNASASMNTGRDEILEVSKVIPKSGSAATLARSLIKFDLTKLNWDDGSISGVRHFLKLYATEPEGLQVAYDLQIASVSQSWTMGIGKIHNTPITTEGASWSYRTGLIAGDYWAPSSPSAGPTFISASGAGTTQSFNYTGSDVFVDVHLIVQRWQENAGPNEGFIVKFTDAEETDLVQYGTLKFFSTETNTIYKPRLYSMWVDATYTTGSVPGNWSGSLGTSDISVYPKGVRPEYSINSVETITVVGRTKYPAKTFVVSQSAYASVGALPSASYYAVQDKYTGEFIIPFSDYTKLSYDGTKNYFRFDFSTLNRNRLDMFLFQIVRENQSQFFYNDNVFKVV